MNDAECVALHGTCCRMAEGLGLRMVIMYGDTFRLYHKAPEGERFTTMKEHIFSSKSVDKMFGYLKGLQHAGKVLPMETISEMARKAI